MSAPEGWEGFLETGETVLWQGRSAGRVTFRGADPRQMLLGLAFFGFALFWTFTAFNAARGSNNPMEFLLPVFGLPFIVIGLRLSGGIEFWRAFVRRNSWYTLTSRRALVATRVLGRRALRSWPITSRTVIDLEQGPPDSIWFAEHRHRAGLSQKARRIGFEQINDGREVLRLMRQVQRGAT